MLHDVAWLHKRHGWPGLKAVVMVGSRREINGKTEMEKGLYITSLAFLASLMGACHPRPPRLRRGMHWAIDNSLHWVLDMVFRDDECRVRTDHAPANFSAIKHMAHNLLRKAPGTTRPAKGGGLG